MDQLFTSVVASQLLCPKCSYRAVSFERQLDLQLEIEEYTDSLEEMLEGQSPVFRLGFRAILALKQHCLPSLRICAHG